MCEEHRNRVADDLDVDVCGFHNRPGHIAQAIENRAKREEAREYFIDKYSRANFRVVPGHWPDFSTKEEVDEWFYEKIKRAIRVEKFLMKRCLSCAWIDEIYTKV